MRVTIFGITGYTGTNLARELLSRGHEVTGVARRVDPRGLPPGITAAAEDVFDADAVRTLSRDADAIVVAVPPLTEEGRPLSDALPWLLDAAHAADARLVYVGGGASLRRRPDGPLIFDDGFPDAWKPVARVHIDVLESLRSGDAPADWVFVSPPEHYGAHEPGERRGEYRVGGDVAVTDAAGASRIGGEDFAIALADELERPAHHRERFTVGY